MSSIGAQLYRRVALAQFYNDYTNAQADPHGFLYPDQNEKLSMKYLTATRKRKRASPSYGAKRRDNRVWSTAVMCRPRMPEMRGSIMWTIWPGLGVRGGGTKALRHVIRGGWLRLDCVGVDQVAACEPILPLRQVVYTTRKNLRGGHCHRPTLSVSCLTSRTAFVFREPTWIYLVTMMLRLCI